MRAVVQDEALQLVTQDGLQVSCHTAGPNHSIQALQEDSNATSTFYWSRFREHRVN